MLYCFWSNLLWDMCTYHYVCIFIYFEWIFWHIVYKNVILRPKLIKCNNLSLGSVNKKNDDISFFIKSVMGYKHPPSYNHLNHFEWILWHIVHNNAILVLKLPPNSKKLDIWSPFYGDQKGEKKIWIFFSFRGLHIYHLICFFQNKCKTLGFRGKKPTFLDFPLYIAI